VLGATVRYSLRYRAGVLAVAALLMLAGLLAGSRVEIDVLPDINRPTLTIMTEAAALAAEEVESLVTQPIELALTGLPSTLRVRSTSATGLSIVNVELDWGAEIVSARQQAAERLAGIRDQLPASTTPQIQPVSSIMGEIMLIAMSAEGAADPMTLRTLADWTVRPRLAAIAGVSQVTVIGGEVAQYRVAPQPALLAMSDISVADIERAIARFGANAGGGFVAQGNSEFVIRAIGGNRDIEALRNTVVASRKGVPVLLRQVAQVSVAAKPVRGSAGVDGKDAVILSVQKQPGADTRQLTRTVTAALETLQPSMPAGVKVDRVIFSQADFVNNGLNNVARALLESSIVVAVILFLFLGNVRATLISLIAIPLSLLSAILVFRAFGMSINTMTLGGLAIAMGELVDDAVVGVENVLRRLKQNAACTEPRAALLVVAEASEEVRSGILYATAIIVLMLLPVFAISGVEGRLFAPLAAAYLVALLASLITAITVTPALCLLLLTRGRQLQAADPPLVRVLKRALARALPWTFSHPGVVIGASAIGFAAALLLLVALPRSLMPSFNEGSLTVEIRLAPGITLAESSRIGSLAEQLLLQVPEVATTGRRTGRAELDEHAQGVHISEIDAALKPSQRKRVDIVADIRRRLSVLLVSINIGQPISHRIDHLLSGVRAEMVIKVFGDDLDQAAAIAERLRAELAAVPGLIDLQVERQASIPAIEVRADARRALLYGTTPAAIVEMVGALANGRAVSHIVDGARRTEVALRLDDKDRTRAGLAGLLVNTPSGSVPVSLMAEVAETTGYGQIERENGRRRVAVYANTQGFDASTVSAVREVMDRTALPAGYAFTLEGAFATQEQAARRVALLGGLALAASFLLLLGRYRSAVLALIVMANVPLSLIGGVVALAIAGLPLSLASIVGFITLAGISIRNGILKVSHYLNLVLIEGLPFGDALILRGSLERLTPVFMTAAAASFALLPLLAEADAPGKEILYPVAVVVFGGLIVATMLDTILTPLLFRRFAAQPVHRLLAGRRRGESAGAL
jgi:HME family heavy-metal exporter